MGVFASDTRPFEPSMRASGTAACLSPDYLTPMGGKSENFGRQTARG